jgi:hypothetical protein
VLSFRRYGMDHDYECVDATTRNGYLRVLTVVQYRDDVCHLSWTRPGSQGSCRVTPGADRIMQWHAAGRIATIERRHDHMQLGSSRYQQNYEQELRKIRNDTWLPNALARVVDCVDAEAKGDRLVAPMKFMQACTVSIRMSCDRQQTASQHIRGLSLPTRDLWDAVSISTPQASEEAYSQ